MVPKHARGKRLSTIPIKTTAEEREAFSAVALAEDRPLGYVMRTLALHGLALYQKQRDKRLREPENIQTVIATAIEATPQDNGGEKILPRAKTHAKSR